VKLYVLVALAVVLASGCNQSAPSLPTASPPVAKAGGKPMPISNANCEALWKETKNVLDQTPATTRRETFRDEFVTTAIYSAVRNLDFDPDLTARSLAFLPINPRSSCRDMVRMVSVDLEKAKAKGLISERTVKIIEMSIQFDQPGTEVGSATVDAVSQCEKKLISPCPLTEMINFHRGDKEYGLKYGSLTFEQIVSSKNIDDLVAFATYRLGCADESSMQLLLNEKGQVPNCRNLALDTALAINGDKVAAQNEAKAVLEEEKNKLGLQ